MSTRAPGRSASPHLRRWRLALPALVLDALLVVAFAATGRASHAEGHVVAGAVGTAAPFLAGMATGWLVVALTRRRVPLSVADGIPVWLCCVVLGLLLRAVTGQGTAAPFVLVATVVLGLLLLGWRSVRAVLLRLTRRS